MKRIVTLTLFMAFAMAGVFAQSTDPNMQGTQATVNPQARAQESTDKINAIAQLTQDQYARILQINRSFYTQVRTVGAGRSARLEAWREQQIKSAVNPDQFERVKSSGILQE